MKQRLIGAIVLGCLAIIFVPVILDGEGLSSPRMNNAMPDAPPVIEFPVLEPQRPVILADTEAITDAVEALAPESFELESEPLTEAVEDSFGELPLQDPQLDISGIPEAWSVRLGSFGNRANANALKERLLEQDYKAYDRPVQTSQGELTGIFVGPVMTRADADSLKQELDENFNLEGIVTRFAIEELDNR